MKEPDISIVIPVLNEDENLRLLYGQLKEALGKFNDKHELIFIDDGSTDSSFNIIEGLNKKDKKVRAIKFRRNFGQTAAIDAGFNAARGKIIIVMDSDLQNDPSDIPKLIEAINQGYDVVSGWRINRKDPIGKKFFSYLSNIIRRTITTEKIHDSGCTLKAYKKECIKDIELYGEMHRYIPSLLYWKGYKVGEVKIQHHPRKFGKSKYGPVRILKGLLDLIVVKFWLQYSTRPIHLFGALGLASLLAGTLTGIYLAIGRLFYGYALANRPLLLLSVLLVIVGLQFLIFGLLADIMIKTYYGHKGKKPYTIEKII